MSKRTYSIQFPYTPSWMQRTKLSFGLHDPKYAGDLAKLKPDLRAKLENCTSSTQFTKADFDGIPDSVWEKLAPHLG